MSELEVVEPVKAEEHKESPVQVGYTVALHEDKSLDFQVLGEKENQGIVELMGVHAYATASLEHLRDQVLDLQPKYLQEIAQVLGRLTQAFNSLAPAMQKMMGDVEELKKQLEDKPKIITL